MEFRKMQEEHLKRIEKSLKNASDEILKRALEHDKDKFENPEIFKAYDQYFAGLKEIKFGTDEYRKYELKHFDKAHQMHAQNRHHYYSYRNNSVKDVNLFDVLEATVDIAQSSKQYGDGLYESSLKSKGIYDYDLETLILNTLKFLDSKEK